MKKRKNRYAKWKGTPQARGLLAVNKLIRLGIMVPAKQRWCVYCMMPARIWHHHNGYDDAHITDVIPLCDKHHAADHKRMREEAKKKAKPLPLPIFL